MGLKKAICVHLDGGPALMKAFQAFFGQDACIVRSLEHVKRNINKEGSKKLRNTSWWDTVKRWVANTAFLRNDHVFDRFWHHAFGILDGAGETDFSQYLRTNQFQKISDLWTANWRAATQTPGYGSYALNAVDSFFKLLDSYVPDEKTLPLLEVMSKYEHTGRVLLNEGQWADVVVEPSTLLTPTLLGDDAESLLSPRLEHKDNKQVGCLNVKTLTRLLEADQPMMLECSSGEGQQVRIFCKYFPSDYNADHMMSLAALETSKQGEEVDAHFRRIEALDAEGFHPRYVTKLYGNFTALYEVDGVLVESHHDFWQRGITEHYIYVGKMYYGHVLPENFSTLVPRSQSTGRKRGRPKGVKKAIGPGDARGKGRGKGKKRKRLTVPAQQADDEFSDPFEDLYHPVIVAPSTPPDMAGRFEIMMQEGILPRTTKEQRQRNRLTSGTTYGVPAGLTDALHAGYLHPNFPPPEGMEWRRTAHKQMSLVPRGG